MQDVANPEAPRIDSDPQASRELLEKAYMIELGHRLRSLRESRGLTQQAVARAAGIATDMVSRLENGHYSSPGLRTLLRIAAGMGVSVAALLPDRDADGPISGPDTVMRARLSGMALRADPEDLELLVDLAQVVVSRRRH